MSPRDRSHRDTGILGHRAHPAPARLGHRRHLPAPAYEGPGGGLELLGDNVALDVVPTVAAPTLEGLVVDVEDAPAPTADDLVARFAERLWLASPRRRRRPGEPLGFGDEVELTIVGYAGGRLIPFSARRLGPVELTPWVHLPGLAEAIALGEVGQMFTVPLTLAEDYPVVALRNQPARFVVEVHAAQEVELIREDEPAELARLGLGEQVADVMDHLAGELEAEAGEALLVEARERVLDALAERIDLEVPPAAIDDEIERRWRETEAPLLGERGFSAPEQDEALATWLADEPTRRAVARRLKLVAGLEAIAAQEGLEPDPDELAALVDETAPGAERPDDASLRTRWAPWARRTRAIEHVMAGATIRFPEDR